MYRLIFSVMALVATASAALCQSTPGTPNDKAFDALMTTLDLERPELEFSYKTGKHKGSSIGFHVAEPGDRKSGSFIPYNTSSIPEAEVVTYRLARFFGVSATYNPVSYYELGPLAAARFKKMLSQHSESDPDRHKNYAHVVAELKATPTKLFGIYRSRPKGKRYSADSLGMSGQFNLGTALAGFIRASGPMPSDRLMSLPGVRGERADYPKPAETERELARQLSVIMVIDQLTGQWDRFWRNLEATGDRNGRLRFMARDNGGATLHDWEGEWHASYVRWVTRYDRNFIDTLRALSAFLNGRSKSFASYETIEDWQAAAGFLKEESYTIFKRKLDLLLDTQIPSLEHKYGARVYLPDPNSAALESAVVSASSAPQPTERRIVRLSTKLKSRQVQSADDANDAPARSASDKPVARKARVRTYAPADKDSDSND